MTADENTETIYALATAGGVQAFNLGISPDTSQIIPPGQNL